MLGMLSRGFRLLRPCEAGIPVAKHAGQIGLLWLVAAPMRNLMPCQMRGHRALKTHGISPTFAAMSDRLRSAIISTRPR